MPSAVPPSRTRRPWLRGVLAAAVAGVCAGGLAIAVTRTLPAEGAVARGVRIGGVAVAPGETARAAAEAAAGRALARRVTLTWNGEPLVEASATDLGARVDVDALERAAVAVGRRGDLTARIDEALEARRGAVDLPVRLDVPVEPLAERLLRTKEERDTPPVAAAGRQAQNRVARA